MLTSQKFQAPANTQINTFTDGKSPFVKPDKTFTADSVIKMYCLELSKENRSTKHLAKAFKMFLDAYFKARKEAERLSVL